MYLRLSFLSLLFFLAPTAVSAKGLLADCLKRCADRQQQRYLRCLQDQPSSRTSPCLRPSEALCHSRCQQYVTQFRDRERHLCTQQYILRMRLCQDLRPSEQHACRHFALQQKHRCLKPCLPAPAESDILRCLKYCNQFQSKKLLRCKRLRLLPRLRRLCEQRYREEYDRCIHLCKRPSALTSPSSQPSPTSLPLRDLPSSPTSRPVR